MKYILLLTFILSVSLLSYGADQTIKLGKTFYTSDHVRAYYATTAKGKRIIYVTNKETNGNEVVFSASPVPAPSRTAKKIRRLTSATAVKSERSVYIAPERRTTPSTKNGIPVCMWKGQPINPIRVGDRLVCPSDDSPQATSPQ